MPREKLQKYGVGKLADYELLAILLGSGILGLNVLELSKKILKEINKRGKETPNDDVWGSHRHDEAERPPTTDELFHTMGRRI